MKRWVKYLRYLEFADNFLRRYFCLVIIWITRGRIYVLNKNRKQRGIAVYLTNHYCILERASYKEGSLVNVRLQNLSMENFGHLTLFRTGGGGAKMHTNSFSSVTSASVRTSPQTFLAFSFNFFATLVYNFKAIPSHSQTIELEP